MYPFEDDDFEDCSIEQNLLNPRKKDEALSKDREIENKEDEIEVDKIQTELMIQADEAARKDKNSSRESIGIGYTKEHKDE